MSVIYFLIAITASTIGAISGIGGGIIIKPAMDAISGLTADGISFLSGCTVLSMAISSYLRGMKNNTQINYKTTSMLAMGAAFGGFAGKIFCASFGSNLDLVQSTMLLCVNLGVYIYVKRKDSILTLQVKSHVICLVIGLALGFISAFLGIGGGPINIAVLYYFFSMTPKATSKNSLFIILFSQATSLLTVLITDSVPHVNVMDLLLMCMGGVAGAMIGSHISFQLSEKSVEKLFSVVLVFLIVLNAFNVVKLF